MGEQVLDSILAGIVTDEEVDSEPYGFRVEWIHWWSGFRGTDLRPGDLVLAVDGRPYDKAQRSSEAPKAIGGYAESQRWAEVGAKDGQPVTLTVLRGRERKDIVGKVVAERFWVDANGQRTLGPGGPITNANDGFDGSWAGWLERNVEDTGSRVLNRGWRRGTVPDNRQMLASFLPDKDRVDFLVKTYPGPFAEQTQADFEAIRDGLLGRRYELTEADLAWRSGGKQTATEAGARGSAARDSFVSNLGKDVIAAFPAVDAMRGDRATVAGKIVALPPLSDTDWTTDVVSQWMVAGNSIDGFYLVQADSPAMRKAFDAMWRYKKQVDAGLQETHEVVGRIGANPRMVVKDGVAITGLEIEPMADLIGGAAFVDLTAAQPQFAGEAALASAGSLELGADASPEQAASVFIEALKQGNEDFWLSLLAPWDASRPDNAPSYSENGGPAGSNYLSMEWVRSRDQLAKTIADIRVVAVDEVQPLVKAGEIAGVPAIDGTTVELEHVAMFDGEYRAFRNIDVHRVRRLARKQGEPWRFLDGYGV
jgi:hypothetical protein